MFLTGRQSRRMLGGLVWVIGTDAWSRVAHGLTIPEEDVRRLHYPDQKVTQAIIARLASIVHVLPFLRSRNEVE